MSIPDDFKWKKYLELNPDLLKLNIIKKRDVVSHYLNYGKNEGRKYTKDESCIDDSPDLHKYNTLFHKYILNIASNKAIQYDIIRTQNITTDILIHLHIYNIETFYDFINEETIHNLIDFGSVIITFVTGNLSDTLLNSPFTILQIQNKGMDIGGKLCMLDYVTQNNISYHYVLFLHSKHNYELRQKYFLPFIKNKERMKLINTLLTINNNGLYGIFPNCVHYTDNYKHSNLFRSNINYFEEMMHLLNIDITNTQYFVEGNCCILHRNVLKTIFKNRISLFYNILNDSNSFDYNWVKNYYYKSKGVNDNINLIDVYKKYTEEKLLGSCLNVNCPIDNNKYWLRDGMIEHVFERLWINIIKKLNGNFLILDSTNIFDTYNIHLNAIYFPQFHETPENNQFWGEGFTEWTLLKPYHDKINVRNRDYNILKPHESIGYYDLSYKDTVKKQIKIAENYNINGFVIYHYWFENKKILYKPLEYFLDDDISFPFCISWANETWSRRWDGTNNEVLIYQRYGDYNDYLLHIHYLIPFFKKTNYMKNSKGECIFYIYNFDDIKTCYTQMINVWINELNKHGLKISIIITENSIKQNHIEYGLNKFIYEPLYSFIYTSHIKQTLKDENLLTSIKFENFDFDYYLKKNTDVFHSFNNLNDIFNHFVQYGFNENRDYKLKEEINYFTIDYNDIIHKYSNNKYDLKNKHLGLPLYWNNIVRRKRKHFIYIENATTDNIEKLFHILICRIVLKYVNCLKVDNSSDNFINVNAWNEWNEQAVLEPNNLTGYENLELLNKISKYV